ncbi:MAG: GntR family transcriptional regulator [Elsteraceae bacterium]
MAEEGGRADQPGTLTEQLYNRLRRDIVLGDLKPGARLKLEALSAEYKASVNTLRETLSRLASDGLVIAEGQRGFTAPPVSMEDLRDVTEMRALLECHALTESIANADLEWEAGVVAAYHKLSRIEAVVQDDPERYGADWERYNRNSTPR